VTARRGGGKGGRRRSAGSSWKTAILVLVFLAALAGGIYWVSARLTPAAEPAPPQADTKIVVEGGGTDAERARIKAAAAPAQGEPAEPAATAEQPAAAAPEPGFFADLLPLLLPVILSVLAGFIGGWAAFRHQRVREHLEQTDIRLSAHFKGIDQQLRELRDKVERGPDADAVAARNAGPPLRRDDRSDRREPLRDRAAEPPAATPPPQQRRTPPDLATAAARFAQLTRGNISRTAFADFFDTLGDSTAVDSADGGRSLQPAQGEGFLTAVESGGYILVFPSYRFVSNWDTQFAFMASVPESVTELFDLTRGDGEIAMASPALFESHSGGAPRRLERGAITGFQG
jgi:hypothetical protein